MLRQKKAPLVEGSGAVGQTWRLIKQPPSEILPQGEIVECDDDHIPSTNRFYRSIFPRSNLRSRHTNHYRCGALSFPLVGLGKWPNRPLDPAKRCRAVIHGHGLEDEGKAAGVLLTRSVAKR
jgi:hypothetical protein